MAPSLCPLGSPRAEQLRRAVIYKLKDWGFPRPDADVLDRFVKLIDHAPPRYELEGSLPPLFPTSRPHPQFFDWLLKDALPKIVETNPSKELAASVPSRMLETWRDRSKSDRSGSGRSGSDRTASDRCGSDRAVPTPPVEPAPERSGSPLVITLERRNKRLVRRVGLAPEPGSAQPLQEPARHASTSSLDGGADRREDPGDHDRRGSEDRTRYRESSRRDDDRKRDDRKRDDDRKRSDDRRSRDHDRRRDDDRRRSDDRRRDEDRGRSSKSDRDSDKRRSESRRSSRSRDRSTSRGRSSARRAESPMSPWSQKPSSQTGSSVAPSRDTSRSSRHRTGRSRERSPDMAAAASRGRSRDRPSHTGSDRHSESARDSPKGFERVEPGFGSASARGSSLGPQSRGPTGFPQEQSMPSHRQQQLMQQQRQQQQMMQHQRQPLLMQAQRQQPHISHRQQQQGHFPNQQQQQFRPPGQFVGGRGGPGGPMNPRFQGNQGPRGPWPAQHVQAAPRPPGNQGGFAALNQAQQPVSQPPTAPPAAAKSYAEQDDYRQEDEYEIPDELDGQATTTSSEVAEQASTTVSSASHQEQAQAQSQPSLQPQTPLQTPPRSQGPAKPKLITDPQPIATYSASFAVRGTPAGPIYNYRYDNSNDYLTRQCAYRDDFYAGHLLDRYVGPPGSLAPFPTSRNDSKSNPTCAILCTPYETGDAPSRCRHWPFCFYGQAARQPCKFWHPTAICADYPNCRYDDARCPFIHPIYFPLVSDPQSNLHGATLDFQGALQTIQLKQTAAGTAPAAAAGGAAASASGSASGPAAAKPSSHTSAVDRAAMATIPCKFGSKCTRKDCAYAHPHTSDRFSLIADDKAVERIATGAGWNNQSGGDLMELDVYGDDALMWQ
ncbi:hypothetical protein AMAG_04859 [Allomyces macrogynus ATCC 38327]|uniref:C3H1-type domain-containing protein n=1 Tax=Allomyces macrogynus (strain ATCC 38327) TaxID=578462 RepID=A0A0L0S644_ALLM3|nr:hypothetical protein AMAG_04859 [Allomyces macrogynus ATCC 38327]|eukprot:KNE58033.1 hypothetical protein AMAG_04859 [Allomyces macrogynus ATCC 38327]